MMKVVGEEGITLADYILYLKGEFFDNVYLQQNAFDVVDMATSEERQKKVFSMIKEIIDATLDLNNKDDARNFFNRIRQLFLDYNSSEWNSNDFLENERLISELFHKYRKACAEIETYIFRQALVESEMDSHFSRSRNSKTQKRRKINNG